ncbi:MAG: sensor histidine kinase [Cyanobacteria bacterium J06631_12]
MGIDNGDFNLSLHRVTPMSHTPTPPRLMLYLEWILLGITAITTVTISLLDVSLGLPVWTLLCIGFLAVSGIRDCPGKSLEQRWLMLAEFGLILLPHWAGDRIPNFPILGMLLVLRSARRLRLLGRYAVAAGVYLFHVLVLFAAEAAPATTFIRMFGTVPKIPNSPANILILKLNAALYYGVMLAFVLLLVNSLVSERQNREYLSATLTQLRQYALRIEDQAALQERNRIAREIHDALGHTLTAQSVQLDGGLVLLNQAKFEQANAFFNTAKALCVQALREVRQSVSVLRREGLSGQSLEAAIAVLVEEFKTTSTITIDGSINVPRSLPAELSFTLYRIVQAALTNIIRHSGATEATLQLTTHNQTLYLVIKDNGRGFNLTQNSTGFGLQGMRERTLALNGQFHLFSEPKAGCLLTIQIPLQSTLP